MAKKQKQTAKQPLSDIDDDVVDKLGLRVVELYKQAKNHRENTKVMGRTVEDWLRRLGNSYNKVHEYEELREREGMRTYFGLIHNKTNMLSAFIKSKYVASGVQPFALNPTPIVELPQDKAQTGLRIVESKLLDVLVAQGLPIDALLAPSGFFYDEVAAFLKKESEKSKNLLREEEMKIAKEAAKEMTVHIQDMLTHGNFEEAVTDFLGYLSLYPAAFMSLDFELVVENQWVGNKFEKKETVRPMFRAVHPKNAFPSPNLSRIEKGSYFIELLKRNRAEYAGFLKSQELGYDKAALKDVLDNANMAWLDKTLDESPFINDDDVIDVLRCQMLVSGADLLDYGVSLAELGGVEEEVKYLYFNADVEVCNHRVVRIMLVQTPNGRKSYFAACYKRMGGGVWGISPAMMIYDRQLSINRTHYAMGMNVYYSSGSSWAIDVSRYDNPSEISMKPYSKYYFSGDGGSNGSGIYPVHTAPTFQALLKQITDEIRLADEECGLPSFLGGNAGLQGAGRTLGGLAIMQDNAVMGIKECFAGIDMYLIRPIIEMLRDVILEDGDVSMHGDCDVQATGLLGLERELEKARAMAGLIPNAAQMAQTGAIPAAMYQDLARDYFEAEGIDTSKYFASAPSISGEMGAALASATPSYVNGLDGRSV